ncbi:hypothetical protein GQ54DRAFT_38998 [Martensiomyces pterosporus]|nr:hypothetical protein GQ54DRAFT_38998 [Martensiomyces pterosporus]
MLIRRGKVTKLRGAVSGVLSARKARCGRGDGSRGSAAKDKKQRGGGKRRCSLDSYQNLPWPRERGGRSTIYRPLRSRLVPGCIRRTFRVLWGGNKRGGARQRRRGCCDGGGGRGLGPSVVGQRKQGQGQLCAKAPTCIVRIAAARLSLWGVFLPLLSTCHLPAAELQGFFSDGGDRYYLPIAVSAGDFSFHVLNFSVSGKNGHSWAWVIQRQRRIVNGSAGRQAGEG